MIKSWFDLRCLYLKNMFNIAATLSTRMSNAQPWRFFHFCYYDYHLVVGSYNEQEAVLSDCKFFMTRVYLLLTTPATPLIKAYQCGFFYA